MPIKKSFKAMCVERILLGAFSHIILMPITLHAGECDKDSFCSIISVQNEVEKRIPQRVGAVIGSIDDDGFKPVSASQVTEKTVCRKEVRVPRVVHDAVMQMFRSVSARGGAQGMPASLNPAEQTMLLYYNTIMQQTMNYQCSVQ